MAELRDKIRSLVRDDKLEAAIDFLLAFLGEREPDLSTELTEQARTLQQNRKQARKGLLTNAEESQVRRRVAFALLDLLAEIQTVSPEAQEAATAPAAREPGAARQAFISYSHHDQEVVQRLAQVLQSAGIVVLMDDKVMRAGEGIESFIRESIARADVTVSVVSRKSLLSAWVATETIQAFERGRFDRGKQLIAGYLDDSFFLPDFRLLATEEIDARLKELDDLLPRYIQAKLDTVELNKEKTRLFHLRNDLGEILLWLKEHLALDLREASFERSLARLIDAIQSQEGAPAGP
jgi:TIR domain/Effector-associated domain 11